MTVKKPKETVAHKKLAAELVSLIPDLDEEGLAFLIEQARVHLYNMRVDDLNAEAEAIARTPAKGGKKGSLKKAEGGGAANFRIERAANGSTYHLISGGKWKMFNEAEMMRLVKIAQSKDPLLEVTGRLYDWLDAERPDTFSDLELGDAHDPKMKELVQFLRKKFLVKKK